MATTNLINISIGDILYQSGNGTPDHDAPIGSRYVDNDTGIQYRAKGGSPFEWTKNDELSPSDVGLGNVPNLDTTDAINRAHTVNRDTMLDSGGGNQITAAETRAHIDDTAGNPHHIVKTDVGLSNVTDDAQLKRSGNDYSVISEKNTPHDDDLILIEDSENAYVKKKVKKSNIGGGGTPTWTISVTKTVYISGVGGNDGNDGSEYTPVKKLSYAFANLKAGSGITKFVLIDTITETIHLDLSSYDNYIIEGHSGAIIYNATTNTTLTIKPTTSKSNIAIRNLTIENATDSGSSQAFDFGTGNGGTINNVVLDGLHLKARGCSVGIWEIVDGTGTFGDNINIRNITVEWGAKPTIPATSYGVMTNVTQSSNKLYIDGFEFVNFGYSAAHSNAVIGIYTFNSNGGQVIIDGCYADVAPIGTGSKELIKGVSTTVRTVIQNADIYIDRGNDIVGTVHGIYYVYCYNVRVKIYGEWDNHDNLSETMGVVPLPGSDNVYGEVENKNTATVQFDYDEKTIGVYLLSSGEDFGNVEGVFICEGEGGDTYTVKEETKVGGLVVYSSGTLRCKNLRGKTILGNHEGSGTCTFKYFDGVRYHGGGGFTDFGMVDRFTAIIETVGGPGTPEALVECAPFGMIKMGFLTAAKLSIGTGELIYSNQCSSGTLADNCIRIRYSATGSGNCTIYTALYKLARIQISSGVGANITILRTNHITI